ncbi:MAG TPA: hypothetical protein VFO52_04480 [Longimicrobiales bacterium]|nr:hypothetical protein [Longimicrobiales bacterium]
MTKKRQAAADGKPPAARTLWAYGYEMIAQHAEDRMAEIRDLLNRQNAEAARDGRKWTARLVARRVMHVMIVSTSPELDLDINRKLETELTALGVQYLTTAPMRVSEEPDAES